MPFNLTYIIAFIGAYFFSFSNNTFAQENNTEYRFVKIKESISNAGVSSILQDNYGFIWMGTTGAGLYRYDGIDYNYYKHTLNDSSTINSNLINCLFFDKNNRLWVGTEQGLSFYTHENDQFNRIQFLDNPQNNISILSLNGDDDHLYIGTIVDGLFKLDLGTLKTERIFNDVDKQSLSTSISAIQIDKYNNIYTGTVDGLKKMNSKTNTLDQAFFITDNGMSTIQTPIQSLLIDNQDNIWVGTISDGLFKIKTNDGVDKLSEVNHFSISENKFLSMITLPDNTIMCGTENDGLIHIDSNGRIIKNYTSNKTVEKSIASNSIWSLCLDRNERIWLGYFNKGVAVYDKLHDKFSHIESLENNKNSLQTGSVTAITQDNSGKFWIGMDGGGIDIYDVKSNKYTHINSSKNSAYSGLKNDHLLSIFIDSNENIWAGSWNRGLFFLKKGTKNFINYTSENTNGNLSSNTIMSFTEDALGTIWIGTFYGGLNSYNPKNKQFSNYNHLSEFQDNEISGGNIRQLIIDHNDNICLAASNGVFKIKQLDNNRFSIQPLSDIMIKNHDTYTKNTHIQSLYESSDQSLWIGTRGTGICRYSDKTETYTWYTKSNGLDQETANGIIESLDGNIWISGNYGISKLDIKTNRITNFTSSDGLLSNDFNINATYKDSQGNLFFGNYEGIDFFNPEKIKHNTSLPSLYLTDFKLFNEKVLVAKKNSPLQKVISETKRITLNSKQSVFTIEYSGINYTRPEKIEYAYYLEGYEESWNYVGKKRSATYTNLDPGSYTFMLKAANNDGLWNKQPLTLEITILPPWWETNWVIFVYAILFLLGFYFLNKMSQNRIREKQLRDNERDKRIQEKELNEKKFQFFTNISHEFRTPLTLIINPIADIIKNDKLNLPEQVKQKHRVIYKNTNRLHRLITELLDFSKLELNKVRIKAKEINLVAFIKDIESYFKEEALTRNIHLNVDTDVLDISLWADEGMLEKIIFNILSNAFKVTPEDGTITIDISIKDTFILPIVDKNTPVEVVDIVISDTGPGLEEAEVERIFERFYQVENLNKTYYGGTGIGLEVVQSFVKLHRGVVKVKSKIGRGTIFKVTLPLGNAHFNENEIISNKTEALVQKERFTTTIPKVEIQKNEGIDTDKNTYTVLIVEDNIDLRNYLKDELKNQYKVLTAKNGTEGLKKAKESLPDIIITDVIMPEMDGFIFCKNIKSDIQTSHIPLLMLTAKSRIENRMEGIELGADAYMVKPFDMRLLKLRLSQLITSRQLIFNKYFSVISDVQNNENTTSLDKEFIKKVMDYISNNIGDPDLNVELLASQLHLSRSQFYRKIKALTNQTANEFLRNVRLQKAKQIIEMGSSNISEVCYKVGFSSPSYFTKCFKSYFGLLPTEVKVK